MKHFFVFLIFTAAAFGQGAIGSAPSGGGAPTIACVGTPGNTPGAYRQQCQDGSNKLYTCGNAAGCAVEADWNLVGAGGSTPPGYTVVPYSATPTFTASSATGSSFSITLTGNVTSSTLAGAVTGQIITTKVCQDSGGAHTFIAPANMIDFSTISSAASACTNQVFIYTGTNAVAMAPAYVTGVAGGSVCLPGATSGVGCIQPPAIAGSAVLTLPGLTAALGVVPALPTPGTSLSLTGTAAIAICTGTCAVAVPIPAAGSQYCILDNVGVTAAITIANPGSSVQFGKTDQSAYGTATSGTLISAAGTNSKICLIGLDSTHYNVGSYSGTWTAN